MLLNGPQAAYASRLALVEGAERTLDLQYYAIHADDSTERLLRSVVAAAHRGVRVRVLLDDFHSTGRNAQVMRMAFVPNIEMRMFNPLTGTRGSVLGRAFSMLTDFDRAQQRMHNKLFIADNAMGITGGRNLGDAYFGKGESGNFVDVDVLASGPIVRELSRSFDSYWNHHNAYPVQSLISQQELDALRDSVRQAQEKQLAPDGTPGESTAASTSTPSQGPSLTNDKPTSDSPSPLEPDAPAWDFTPMDLNHVKWVFAPAVVLVDQPAKISADGYEASVQPAVAPAQATPLQITTGAKGSTGSAALPRTAPSPSQAAGTQPSAPAPGPLGNAHTDTVVDGLLQLMGQARQELLIVSPYFVPGSDMKTALAAAQARGVQVSVLTNSLASNDAPIAHAGYARHRKELLTMGIDLYEMRGELESSVRSSLGGTGSSGGNTTGASRAMLHSKLLVMDGQLLVVGSMNLDLRSQKHNTEIALLIRSRELAEQAAQQLRNDLNTAAWHVRLQADGSLLWQAPPGSDWRDRSTEPDASLTLRLLLKLFGALAPDHLL